MLSTARRFYATSWIKQKQAAHKAQLTASRLLQKGLPSVRDQLHGHVLDEFSNSLALLQSLTFSAPKHLRPQLLAKMPKFEQECDALSAVQVVHDLGLDQPPDSAELLTMPLLQKWLLIEAIDQSDRIELKNALYDECSRTIRHIQWIQSLILDK